MAAWGTNTLEEEHREGCKGASREGKEGVRPGHPGMEFLQGQSAETTVAVAVAVVAVAAGAAFLLRSKKPKGCLDPENFKEFKLVEKRQLSHNVAKFKFALPTPTSVLGLPIGQHISCRGQDAAGEEVIKPYTPTTLDSDLGYFELVIKMYTQGRMSHHFREMKVGEYLSVKGPKGRFKYQPGQVRAFGMLAGGSGITPMFQVTRAILENPNDNTKVHLIYANVTYEDILLKVSTFAIIPRVTRSNNLSNSNKRKKVSPKGLTFARCVVAG